MIARCLMLGLLAVLALGADASCGKVQADEQSPRFSGCKYLDNGQIRLGVDLDLGGAITYLSDANSDNNVVNSYDFGRQIQMSFYAGPVPFGVGDKQPKKHWSHIGWNPIQSGDDFQHGSRVIDYRQDGNSLYLKCVPLQWPLDNVPAECTFECWITLAGHTAEVRGRLNNQRSDKTQYAARTQELPAVYTNGPLYRLMTYTGRRPFTGDSLERIVKPVDNPAPWARWLATENWAALVNDADWGLGIWNPGCFRFSGGFAGVPGAGGPKDNPTGYIAPNHDEILDHDIQYEFSYVLILGPLDEIRQYVYRHAARPFLPDYEFRANRQHWRLVNAQDAGWPLKGDWQVKLDQPDPQLFSPEACWQADEVPRILIEAAYHTASGQGTGVIRAQLFWKRFDDRGFSEQRSVNFAIQPDGQFHTYTLELASSADYRGATITGLRFDPTPNGVAGDCVMIRRIAAVKLEDKQQPGHR
jgi:hypothetical protein